MIPVLVFFVFLTYCAFVMTGEQRCPFCGNPVSKCDCPYGELN